MAVASGPSDDALPHFPNAGYIILLRSSNPQRQTWKLGPESTNLKKVKKTYILNRWLVSCRVVLLVGGRLPF